MNPLTRDESRGGRTLALLAPTFGRTRMCQTAPPLRGLKSSALQAAIHQRTKVRRFLAVAIKLQAWIHIGILFGYSEMMDPKSVTANSI
jgi:hypothetical protein